MYDAYFPLFNDLFLKSSKFQDLLRKQRAEDGTLFSEAAASLERANDAAFEGLETLVVQLLEIKEGGSPVGKDAVPQLPVAIELFHKLAKSCEDSVDRIGQEFIDTTQSGGENKQIQNDVQVLLDKMSVEASSAEDALRRAEGRSRDSSESFNNAENALRDAKNKRDGWYDISSFFGGGGDIDSQVQTNERNLENCQRDLSNARRDEDDCRNDLAKLRKLIPMAQELLKTLDELFWQMNAEYEKIVKDRKIIERTWVATRTLDYHVTTSDIDTSRDDILRHVVQLIHERVEQVDDDPHVQRFKENIERKMRESLGNAKVEELHQERQFLPLEDLNF